MKADKLLNPRQAAQKLGIGMPRVYALLYSGKLRAEKHGARWAIPESAITERLRHVGQFQKLQGASAYESDK